MQLKWPMRWDLFSLFPAYAGVIPVCHLGSPLPVPFPRIRGGDPNHDADLRLKRWAQKKAMEHYGWPEAWFIQEFGRSYL